MHRRTFLQAVSAGAAVGLGGCVDPEDVVGGRYPRTSGAPEKSVEPTAEPADEPIPGADEYETVVDLGEQGADDTGGESILPLLEEHVDDDTLLYLTDGVFKMDGPFVVDDLSNVAVVGSEATIQPSVGFDETLISLTVEEGLRVQGIEFDFSEGAAGGRALQLATPDDLEVIDITVTGTFDAGPGVVRLDVTDADGSGVVDNLSLPDGATVASDASGLYVGNDSYGDLTFRDCHIEGFPDNGLYADPPGGDMHVEGGYYANNGISNVRVKGGSTVRNVHVRCDRDHEEGFRNMRGIRATDYRPRADTDPVLIEDCRIEMRAVTSSDGGIVLSSQLAELVVVDTNLTIDADNVEGIWAKPPDPEITAGNTPPRLHCENVSVTGSAAHGSAIRIGERDGCSLEDNYIHQSGLHRDGIELRRSDDNVIRNSIISVDGESIRLVDSTADVEGTISGQAQPFPFY